MEKNDLNTIFGELSVHEREVLMPLVMQMLSHRNTKQKVFSNTKIRKVLKEFGEDINDSQIRKIVFYVRNNDLINLLIANNEGYFVSYNRADVEKWIQMQEGKISAMQSTLFSVKRQLLNNVKAMVEGEATEMKGQMSIYDIIS